MSVNVEIDSGSGFCGGVIRAIGTAERFLEENPGCSLYSLGSIVHNEKELGRLERKGLRTVSYEGLQSLSKSEPSSRVLIRAHGEPPQTYRTAAELGLSVIDCTCPVVLQLQKRIRDAWQRLQGRGRIFIFGKVGHAEVLGLVGQADGEAIVIENMEMLEGALAAEPLRNREPVEIFSQTTKSPSEYARICERLTLSVSKANALSSNEIIEYGLLTVHNTICSQVAFRHVRLADFARAHDAVVFVSGAESSNGRVLSELCSCVNPHTHIVRGEEDVDPNWFHDGDCVGVCGATSTPRWLLEAVSRRIQGI